MLIFLSMDRQMRSVRKYIALRKRNIFEKKIIKSCVINEYYTQGQFYNLEQIRINDYFQGDINLGTPSGDIYPFNKRVCT